MMLMTNRPTTIWQRLRDEHSLVVGLKSFRRYMRYMWLEFPDETNADDAAVRPEVDAGLEGQID